MILHWRLEDVSFTRWCYLILNPTFSLKNQHVNTKHSMICLSNINLLVFFSAGLSPVISPSHPAPPQHHPHLQGVCARSPSPCRPIGYQHPLQGVPVRSWAKAWTNRWRTMPRACGVQTSSRAFRKRWPSIRPAADARSSYQMRARCTVSPSHFISMLIILRQVSLNTTAHRLLF